ncbi:MAG: hypothetical protein MPJ24_08425, partial [Pirellulaceae bacterium]|nr:hypothetical protein [Pirellulaceae bacterium]
WEILQPSLTVAVVDKEKVWQAIGMSGGISLVGIVLFGGLLRRSRTSCVFESVPQVAQITNVPVAAAFVRSGEAYSKTVVSEWGKRFSTWGFTLSSSIWGLFLLAILWYFVVVVWGGEKAPLTSEQLFSMFFYYFRGY